MKRILVVGGNGKMGSLVVQKLQKNENYFVQVVGSNDNLDSIDSADMIIDFANAGSSVISAKYAVRKKIPLIVGSTGQDEIQTQEILSAGESVPVLKCSNFSLGIAKMKELISSVLNLSVQDVAIFEKHHNEKKDSPSGTALELEKEVKEKFDGNVQMLSERGGKEIGTHKIDFYFGSEVLSITHQAFSREVFADGVVTAVGFMFGKSKGVYDFQSVVQNIQN